MSERVRLCDICGINPAEYYTKEIINGIVRERYLCKECEYNHAFLKPKQAILGNMLSAFADTYLKADVQKKKRVCSCGKTVDSYYETGFLGCPECYKVFEAELDSAVQKIQKDTRHTGKVPTSVQSIEERRLSELLKQREEAVQREDYAAAAEINEQMKELARRIKGGEANG